MEPFHRRTLTKRGIGVGAAVQKLAKPHSPAPLPPAPLPPFQRKEGYMVGFVHALIVIQSEPSRICSRLSVVAACCTSQCHACFLAWRCDDTTGQPRFGSGIQHRITTSTRRTALPFPLLKSPHEFQSNSENKQGYATASHTLHLRVHVTLQLHNITLHLFSQAASPVICAFPVSPVTKRRAIRSHAWNNNNNTHEIRALQQMFVPTTRMWTHVSPNTNMSHASSRWKNKWQPRHGTLSWSQ